MWSYVQVNGQIWHEGQVKGSGYSGSPEGKNSPAMESIHNVGPIPCGIYSIGDPFDSETHGPYCLPLTPDAANEMFGRSGFLIHGDKIGAPGTASEGCIILYRPLRMEIWESADRGLQVVSGQ